MSRFELPLWRRLFRLPTPDPRDAAAEVDSELEFHLQMRVDELMALGMTEADARAEALRRFGNLGRTRAELARESESRARSLRLVTWLEDLGQDLRLALRGMGRRPVLAVVAIVTLALGLGLTTTVLAVVNRLVLHPLPYPGSDRFATVWLASDQTAMRISPTLQMLGAWHAHPPSAEWIEAHSSEQLLLEGEEVAELVQTRSVSPGLLPALEARVALGRGIEPVDTTAGASLVTVLSWGAWKRRFGGAPDVLGRTVRLHGKIAMVVGVLEKGFDLSPMDGSARAEFWLPLGGPGQGEESASILVLRRPGVPVEVITAELGAALAAEGITSDLLERFPPRAYDPGEFADEDRERTLWLLTLAVSLVLVIACANVAALLLGQAAVRAREFGVRAALGAGRGRVVRQLLTEAGVLGALGGVAGFAVAKAALWLMRATRPETLLTLDDVAFAPGVTLAGLGLTMSVAVLFGLAPAWAVSRADAAAALVGRVKRSLDSRFGRSLRSALVVGQLAASLVLVSGAGLLVRSFVAERNIPVGFEPAGLGWVRFSLSERAFPNPAERVAIAEEVRAAVSRMPELRIVALAGDSPLGYGIVQAEFLIDGRPLPDRETESLIPFSQIGPGYFEAIGARLEAGRPPDPKAASTEIVIDATTARQFFPAGDAVGSRIRYRRTDPWKTIVGVAPRQRALLGAFEDAPFVFELPWEGAHMETLIVRADGEIPLQRITALIRATDPRIRIRSAEIAESALDERLAGRRFTMTIMIGFAGLALLLAAVGLYGVVALAVSQRTYEMGVRIALGAAPSSVQLLVLREGGVRVAIGLGLGFVLLIALGRLLRGLLSDVRAWDPVVWGAAAAALTLSGILACWIPARRASRTDPMIALRAE